MLFNSVKEERRDISNYSTTKILHSRQIALQLYSRKIFTSGENNSFFLSNDIKYFVMTGGYTSVRIQKLQLSI